MNGFEFKGARILVQPIADECTAWQDLGSIADGKIEFAPTDADSAEALLYRTQHTITVSGQLSVDLWKLLIRPGPTFLPAPAYVQSDTLGLAEKCEHWRDHRFPELRVTQHPFDKSKVLYIDLAS